MIIKSIKSRRAGEMAVRRMSDRAYEAYSGACYDVLATVNGIYTIRFHNSTEVVADNLSFEELEAFFEAEADEDEAFYKEESRS